MAKVEARAAALPDAEARRAIAEDLETSLLVEAAAGTGKTTSLVKRLTALIRSGTATIDRLTAVTFTIKAAAELSERFQASLEAAAREASGDERRRLDAALARLDAAFVGTIHAFCARLLRERPVEARVDPGFAEMDEPENAAARQQAWDRHAERLFVEDSPVLPRLARLGVRLEDLRQTYETLSDNEDVETVIGPEAPPPDFATERGAVERFLEHAAATLPAEMPPDGWTEFQQAVRRARRLLALRKRDDAPAFAQALDAMHKARKKGTEAGRLRGEFESLIAEVVQPGLRRWRVYLHPIVLGAAEPAAREYAVWRLRAGRLNFQDLLLLARDLLRDHPAVRRAFQQRFLPILVDEFQDTDPIQTEILFYLTGRDTEEKDWRKLRPLAGSLFVVGDPKQSIYRFRRADIETYAAVRERLEQTGRVLNLTANFRSTGRLCDWVNGVFSRDFPPAATAEQAAWVPLAAQRPEGAPAVFRLLTRTATQATVVAEDARRVAGAIAAAVESDERRPEDFLVLFRTRKQMPDYARALEARGIPYELSGGGAFKDSDELQALLPLLEAISDPDDPVPFTAVLRGPLFGVDDGALYRHAKSGGRFSFRAALPDGADPRIAQACARLAEGENLASTLPPGAAISRLCGRLGFTAYAGARELADSRAGNLLKAISAARTFSAEGLDFAAVVAELRRLTSEGYIEEMGAQPGRPGAVRLMTLHGAKGLEAPVVFLADPRRSPDRPARYWIDRREASAEGHWRVIRETEGFGVVEIAEPEHWDEMERIEKAFDDAEKKRLLYVAATRAKETLVVSIWKQGKSENARGPWAPLSAFLREDLAEPAVAVAPAPAPAPTGLEGELVAFAEALATRRVSSATPTYAVETVTRIAHAGPQPAWQRTGRGMSWGRVLHRLLEVAMREGEDFALRPYAANLLTDEERPAEEVDEVVRLAEAARASELWQRASKARRRLVEVPFALAVPREELGLSVGPERPLLQGAIDLAFEEPEGWVLVDYKSDTIAGNLEELAAFYKPQVEIYRRYWERLTGAPARAGLFFLATGDVVWLDGQAGPLHASAAP